MDTPSIITRRATETLESAISGDVFAAGDRGYDEARRAWNLADQRPAAVVFAKSAPDELTSIGRILRVPPLPELPEPIRGRAFALVEAAYLGDAANGNELLRPLRDLGPELDTFAMILAPALQQLNMDPVEPLAVEGDGMLLAEAPIDAIDTLVAVTGPDADTPLLSVELRHLGGALAREAPGGGAQPSIASTYLMYAAGVATTPDLGETVRSNARAVNEALGAWRAGYDYYYFLETPAGAGAVLPPASFRRLREIKATYDPDPGNSLRRPVPPAATDYGIDGVGNELDVTGDHRLERGRVDPAAAETSIGAGPVRDVPVSRNPNTVALFRVLRGGIPGADDGGWYPTRGSLRTGTAFRVRAVGAPHD